MKISGIILKHALQNAGITQKDAAEKLFISRPTLSVWCNKDVLTDDIIKLVKENLNIDLTNVKTEKEIIVDELIHQFKQRLVDKDKIINDKEEIIKLLKEKIKH